MKYKVDSSADFGLFSDQAGGTPPAFSLSGRAGVLGCRHILTPDAPGAAFMTTNRATNKAQVLLWTDSPAAYLEAVKAAGLDERVAIDTLPRKDKPSADQLARTEALMAGGVPAGAPNASQPATR